MIEKKDERPTKGFLLENLFFPNRIVETYVSD